jgi:hypothetical protein
MLKIHNTPLQRDPPLKPSERKHHEGQDQGTKKAVASWWAHQLQGDKGFGGYGSAQLWGRQQQDG